MRSFGSPNACFYDVLSVVIQAVEIKCLWQVTTYGVNGSLVLISEEGVVRRIDAGMYFVDKFPKMVPISRIFIPE